MKENIISSADYSNDVAQAIRTVPYQTEMETCTWGVHLKDALLINDQDYEYLYSVLQNWRNGIRTTCTFDVERLHAIAAQFDGIDGMHPHYKEVKYFLIHWYVCYMDTLWSTACDRQAYPYLWSTKRQRIILFLCEMKTHSLILKMLKRIMRMFSRHRPRKDKMIS